MRDAYIYTTPDARSIRISESVNEDDAVHVSVSSGSGLHIGLDIPRAQRRHAAQALAGDRYEINERLADWERELLDKQTRIDPAAVKVGDIVSVEADDGTWLVRGEYMGPGLLHRGLLILEIGGSNQSVPFADATVHLVRRAEPEPDPAEVEALTPIVRDVNLITWDSSEEYARELVRRGVTVRKET